MIEPQGHVKLIDMGIAHCMRDGNVVRPSGSAHYMSPVTRRATYTCARWLFGPTG